MAAATHLLRASPGREATPPALLPAFIRLCRQLARPPGVAELAAAMPRDGPADLDWLARYARALGLELERQRAGRRSLSRCATPFVLVGREPGSAWFVRARIQDRLVMIDPVSGATQVRTPAEALALGRTLARVVPRAAPAAPANTPQPPPSTR